MPSIYQLKPAFQNLLRPITRSLADAGVTANQVTLAALLLSILTGALVFNFNTAHWPLLLVPLTLFVRMALNAIDGMLARDYDMRSRLGALLNELGDVLSDAALYLPLAVVPGVPAALIVLLVTLGIIGEMTGVLSIQIGGSRRYDGPLGKSDRAFVLGAIALLLGMGISAGMWLTLLLLVLLLLVVLTILNRARHALKERPADAVY